MERTLIILKPDALQRGLVGKIGLMRSEGLARIGCGKLLDQRVGLRARGAIGEGDGVAGGGERTHDRGAEPASAASDQYAALFSSLHSGLHSVP